MCHFWYNDVKICLNFHIFEDLNFDFLIGHPLKALFKDVPKDRCLNIKLGKDTLHIPMGVLNVVRNAQSASGNFSFHPFPIFEDMKV